MPIPLGVLAVAGAGGGAAGAFDLLETTVLANNSTQSISFTGLGSYSAYKHLQLRGVIQTQRASSSDVGVMRFNSDSGSNYTWHWLTANGSTVGSEGYTSRTYARINEVATNHFSGGLSGWTPITIDILDFSNTSKNKTIRIFYGQPFTLGGSQVIQLASSVWMSNSAITSMSIDFTLSGNNYSAGSRLSLYGVK